MHFILVLAYGESLSARLWQLYVAMQLCYSYQVMHLMFSEYASDRLEFLFEFREWTL
jgi:hypothetical protein